MYTYMVVCTPTWLYVHLYGCMADANTALHVSLLLQDGAHPNPSFVTGQERFDAQQATEEEGAERGDKEGTSGGRQGELEGVEEGEGEGEEEGFKQGGGVGGAEEGGEGAADRPSLQVGLGKALITLIDAA